MESEAEYAGPVSRYAKANNPLVEHDTTKPNYLPVVLGRQQPLYGWAMSQYLPVRDFEWVGNTKNH